MNKLILKLIVLVAFPMSFMACKSAAQDGNKKKEVSNDVVVEDGKSLLWKIEGNGLKKPSYLFGTMHMIEEAYFVFPDALKERIKTCDKIIMELPGLPGPKEAMDLMMAKEGEQMKDILTPEHYDSVLVFAIEKLGTSKESFEKIYGKMKPLALISAISALSFKGKIESYEMTLISLSKKEKIEVDGLETIEQQMGFFTSIPQAEMAEMIMTTVRKMGEDSGEEMVEMMKIYKDQDLEKLITFMAETSPELMLNEEILLSGRNKAWIPKIEKFTKNSQCFIAVGAAHLVGPNGVINLLKEAGYTLTPISTEK